MSIRTSKHYCQFPATCLPFYQRICLLNMQIDVTDLNKHTDKYITEFRILLLP